MAMEQAFPNEISGHVVLTVGGVGVIIYKPDQYKGTTEDLKWLEAQSRTPEFLKQYPHDTVFADGQKFIGCYDNGDIDGIDSPEAQTAMNKVAELRGIKTWNFAIIKTGPQKISSSLK